MAVTSLLLVLADHRYAAEVQAAGQWYAVMTQFGAAAMLLGLVLLATAHREPVVRRDRRTAAHFAPWVRCTAFVLAVVGFGSKAGAVPLHVWLPRAHPEAPGPVSALMSAAMVNLGIYGIIRVGDGLLGGGPAWWWLLVMALGGLSALFGALHSATSTDLKRLLAYSTTDNIGLMLLGRGRLGPVRRDRAPLAGAGGPGRRALPRGLPRRVQGLAVPRRPARSSRRPGTADLDRLGGLLERMPITGRLFLVGGLAICALPLLCGFVSEWLLLQSLLHGLPSANPAVAVAMPLGVGVLALTGGLTALTFVKAAGIGLLGQPRSEPAAAARRGRPVDVGAAPGSWPLLCVVFGVAPFLVLPAVVDAARSVTWHPRPRPAGSGLAASGSRASTACWPPGCWRSALVVAAVAWSAGSAGWSSAGRCGGPRRGGAGGRSRRPRMEYTATSFAEPLTRVFEDVLGPAHDLDVSHVAESRYYVEAATFHTTLDDAFERHALPPADSAACGWWGAGRPAGAERERAPLPGLRPGGAVVVLVVVA